MHLDLDVFLTDEEQKSFFLKILDLTEQYLNTKGKEISVEELNSFPQIEELQSRWTCPIETARVVKIISYLKQVVLEKLKITASDPIDYHF